jgi:hypothetical protein
LARIIVEYCLDRNLDFTLIDADRSNPDVGSFYREKYKQVALSEREKHFEEADLIFNLALEKPAIVNLPSGIEAALTGWIERNGLVGTRLAARYNLRFYQWFVCTGEPDGMQFFRDSVNRFGGKISHILVKNMLHEENWSRWDRDEKLLALLQQYQIGELRLPRLHKRYADLIVFERFSFRNIVARTSGLPHRVRRGVFNYLRLTYAAIAQLGLLTEEQFVEHTRNR